MLAFVLSGERVRSAYDPILWLQQHSPGSPGEASTNKNVSVILAWCSQQTSLLRGMYTDKVLLHRDSQLLQSLFSFFLHLLSPRQLFFPRLVQTLHQLFARFHLFLQLCLRDRLDLPVLRLVCDLLLLRGYMRVERILPT